MASRANSSRLNVSGLLDGSMCALSNHSFTFFPRLFSELESIFLLCENAVFIIMKNISSAKTLTGGFAPDTTTNYLTSIGLSGKTLKQGAIIYAPGDAVFTNLTLTSGSIIAYSE